MITFEESALTAIDLINNTSDNVFLTGQAGTGKSTLVRHILEKTGKAAIILAPTGIAAINIGGSTIHSMLGIPIGMYLMEDIEEDVPFNTFGNDDLIAKSGRISRTKKAAIKHAEFMVIDEVSMLRADLLDAVDKMLRLIRNSKKKFGGLQVLFVGDMLQLPPVLTEIEKSFFYKNYESEFFFEAKCVAGMLMHKIELKQIHRQVDLDFISVLNNLRSMKLTAEDVTILNSKVNGGDMSTENGIYITTHNYKADAINASMIDKIKEEPSTYTAMVDGYFNSNNVLAPDELVVKTGMRVMTVVNNGDDYFNGKIGTVGEHSDKSIQVIFEDGKYVIDKYTWENIAMEYDHTTRKIRKVVMGTFTQFPLKAAYAITVHKSQGLTFSKAILDINEVFSSGQAYTALSRLRNLSGLTLINPISTGIQLQMNARLFEFINS